MLILFCDFVAGQFFAVKKKKEKEQKLLANNNCVIFENCVLVGFNRILNKFVFTTTIYTYIYEEIHALVALQSIRLDVRYIKYNTVYLSIRKGHENIREKGAVKEILCVF